MRVIVTCGPGYEPIDRVRRITNFSTGELGLLLAQRLARAGFEVICLKGVGATFHLPLPGVFVTRFTTNENLLRKLRRIAARAPVAAVFHAAALSDFRVKSVSSAAGEPLREKKISSRAGELTLTLEPVPKLIRELRTLFPASRLVGWKYGLDGSRAELLEASERQMREAATDACVLNGAAYGAGFGFCAGGEPPVHFTDKAALCEGLVRWAS